MPQPDWEWLLQNLEGVEGSGTQYTAWCPVHDDIGTEWKGLSLTLMGDKILVKCHSCGATLPKVMEALNNGGYNGHAEDIPVTIRSHSGKKGMAWWVNKTGVAQDIWESMDCVEDGNGVAFLFQDDLRKIRKPPKDIIWEPAGADTPPLWPTVEDEMPRHIWITEGESDAGTARAAGHHAYAVTKGSKTAMPFGWAEALQRRGVEEVTVCGDTDEPGMEFATSLVRDVMNAGMRVNRVRLELVIDPFSGLNDLNGVYRACTNQKEFKDYLERATDKGELRMKVFTAAEAEELAKQEIPWVVPNLICPGDKVLVSGPQKTYKSFLCLDLMRSLTTGSPFLMRSEWTPTRTCKTLYVQEEGGKESWAQRVSRAQIPESGVFLHKHGFRFTEPDTIMDLITLVRAAEIEVVILDPMQRMIPGVNENDSSEVGIVWDEIQNIHQVCPDLVVVVVHHANKSDRLTWESIRGSSRHAGEVDLGFFTQKTDHGMQIAVDGRDIPQYLGTGEAFDAQIEITDDDFRIDAREVRVAFTKKQLKAQDNRELVLIALQDACDTRTKIMHHTNLSDSTVRGYLDSLVEQGHVIEAKQGPGMPNLYTLKESSGDSTADPDAA